MDAGWEGRLLPLCHQPPQIFLLIISLKWSAVDNSANGLTSRGALALHLRFIHGVEKTLDESEQVESLSGDEFVKKNRNFLQNLLNLFFPRQKNVAKFKFEVFSSFASKSFCFVFVWIKKLVLFRVSIEFRDFSKVGSNVTKFNRGHNSLRMNFLFFQPASIESQKQGYLDDKPGPWP